MDVDAWLENLGLGQYAGVFAENRVGADVLSDLSDDDLEKLSIPLGDRKRLLKAIAALGDGAETPAAPEPRLSTSSEAERRQLTIMFCDMVGSTALSNSLDPEDYREIIRAYQTSCSEVIRRYEGYLAKFLGDGVLAYFGYPQAHEEDAERAVLAGLDLVAAVNRLDTQPSHGLQVRVGIATGQVVAGDLVGDGVVEEKAVLGQTPNLASRLQDLAQPGWVVIAEDTQRLVAGLFEQEDMGEQTLKGISEPVRAWRVLGERAAASRFAARTESLTSFVGRDEELALLLERWERAKKGEGQAILLSGEAGIGKSRIVWALQQRIAREDHILLRYQCSPFHTNSAFYPIVNQLESAVGFATDESPDRKLDKLEAFLAQATNGTAIVVPLFAALLSIPTGDRYPPMEMPPQRQKEKTLEALTDQVLGLATRRLLLFILEDGQWIDPSTQEAVERTIEQVQAARVLMIITSRPGHSLLWSAQGHVTSLTLNRLSQRQSTVLVDNVAAGKTLPSKVLDQIVAKADGVPLFIEELTKAMLEADFLEDRANGDAFREPLPSPAVPSSLKDSLMARLDRVTVVKEVAQIGAVIGRSFSYELLQSLSPMPKRKLQGALEQLNQSGLVFRRGAPPESNYTFKHALLQDAAYDSLLLTTRRELHARLARTLEKQHPTKGETEPELLAYHYTRANLPNEAIAYLQKAGRRAIERSANLEAIEHFRQALDLIGRQPASADRRHQEVELHLALGAALIAPRGYAAEEVRRAYARAVDLCQEGDDREPLFRAVRGLWNCHLMRGELRRASELAAELLSLAQGSNDPKRVLIAHRVSGTTHFGLGEHELANQHMEQGIDLYDPNDHQSYVLQYGEDPGLWCYVYSGWITDWLGFGDRALDKAQQAIALVEQLPTRHSLAYVLASTATFYQYRREPRLALEYAESAITVSTEQDIAQQLAWASVHRGWALAMLEKAEQGLTQLQEGVAAWRAIEGEKALPHFLTLLAETYGKVGQPELGLAKLDEAEDIVRRTNHRSYEVELHRQRGELLRKLPKPSDGKAENSFLRAIEVAQMQHTKTLELRAAVSLGRLWQDRGRATEVRELIEPLYDWFTEGFNTVDLKEAKLLLDDLK
ncbi:MAG: AAA family ATPase [Alphaproteobacteria bacterium]|nr:AAA family ATPase [Alphaproteobacteria bacterium]